MKEYRPIHFITPTVLTYLKVYIISYSSSEYFSVKDPLAVQY